MHLQILRCKCKWTRKERTINVAASEAAAMLLMGAVERENPEMVLTPGDPSCIFLTIMNAQYLLSDPSYSILELFNFLVAEQNSKKLRDYNSA